MATFVSFPTFLSANTATFAITVCNSAVQAEDDIEIDASDVKFVDPFGLAIMGATFYTIRKRGYDVRVIGLSPDVAGYLQRMDVFDGVELVNIQANNGFRADRSDALVELTRLDHTINSGNTAYQLARAIVGKIPGNNLDAVPDDMTGLTLVDQLVMPIHYALSELLENALTHARAYGYSNAHVWVASQYYPRKDIVRLGVVDNGCGFLESLRRHPELKRKSHLDAILIALRPRISCNRDLGLYGESVNQGVGLTTTCRIAEHSGGRMVIASGNGLHSTVGRSSEMPQGGWWQGVAIGMECHRNLLRDIRISKILPMLETRPPIKLRFD